jgi:hypothetical protein
MTDPDPQRWERDSAAEDFEVRRARSLDELAAWARDQRYRPLLDALGADGIARSHREALAITEAVPEWWADVEAPAPRCNLCQAPAGDDPCGPCREAQRAGPSPASLLAYWAERPAEVRRLLLAAKYRTDPWSGRPVVIECAWSESAGPDEEPGVITGRHRLIPVTPVCRWDALRG